MNGTSRTDRGASLARPLAFTLLTLYGLLSFLSGYDDWSNKHRLEPWAAWLLIAFGIMLGSAAIRVIKRRRRAFGLSLFAMIGLMVLDLVADLSPAEGAAWKLQLGRAALSLGLLWLVRISDRAVESDTAG